MNLYRGINGAYADTDGLDGKFGDNLFATDDASYAKSYALCNDNPSIIEYGVDENELSIATLGDLYGIFGMEFDVQMLYDGLDEHETEKVLANGFNCICFDTEDRSSTIYYLLNRDAIISRRVMSTEEVEAIGESSAVQYKGLSDSENPKGVELLKRKNISFLKAIQDIAAKQAIVSDRLIYESVNELDEGVGSAVRTSVLASLLAVPGILSAKEIDRGIRDIRQKAPLSMQNSEVKKVLNGENKESSSGYTKAQSANIIARTLFGEGSGESHEGRLGIATTLYNRGRGNVQSMTSACLKPLAYSCWNGIPSANRTPKAYVNSLPPRVLKNINNSSVISAWNDCVNIASDMVEGKFSPYFRDGNYTHYVTVDLYNNPKSNGRWFWKKPGKVFGNHIFFTAKNANSKPIVSSKAEIAVMQRKGTASIPNNAVAKK